MKFSKNVFSYVLWSVAVIGSTIFQSTFALAADSVSVSGDSLCGEPFAVRASVYECHFLFRKQFPEGCDQDSPMWKKVTQSRVPATPDDTLWYTKQFSGIEPVIPHDLKVMERFVTPEDFYFWKIVDSCSYPIFVHLAERAARLQCHDSAGLRTSELKSIGCTANYVLGRAQNLAVQVLSIDQVPQDFLNPLSPFVPVPPK